MGKSTKTVKSKGAAQDSSEMRDINFLNSDEVIIKDKNSKESYSYGKESSNKISKV